MNRDDELKRAVPGLNLPADPWCADQAQMKREDIQTDQAWAQQKAAFSCNSMIVRFSDFRKVEDVLSPVVTEEWGHFRSLFQLGRFGQSVYG